MEVDDPCDENAKQNTENNTNSFPEESLLGSITTNALDKVERGLQIRSSARVFKKMKLEQEQDKKSAHLSLKSDEDKNNVEFTSNITVVDLSIFTSPSTEQPVGGIATTAEIEVKGPPIRSSARVVKKAKLEAANTSISVPDKKDKKEDTKHDNKKAVRSYWNGEEKAMFFEAVNEFGKDFENIQLYINNKLKKRGAVDEQMKTKDHVRQFYNRTFHEISKHVKYSDSVKKVVQELYGIINYGELHRKLGPLSEKACMKLNELIYRGATVIRSKGKNVRIKTPMCKALIKLNQLDEKYEEVKLPNRVTVELRPKDMMSYLRVQHIAQNPRLKTTIPLQKRLSSLILCLSKRWKTVEALTYEKALISTNPITNDCVPSKKESEGNWDILSPPLRLSPPADAKIELPLINLSDYLTRQTICLSAYEARIGLDTYSDIKITSKRKKQKCDNEQKIDIICDKSEDKAFMKIEENEANSCNETESDAVLADAVDDAVNTILLLQQGFERQNSETSEMDESVKLETETESEVEIKQEELLNTEAIEQIKNIRKGWTEKDSNTLTIGEIYLMYGSDSKLILEYSWESEDKDIETKKTAANFLERWQETYDECYENRQQNLSSSLAKLLSLAKLHYRKNIIKCPCGHVCNSKNTTNIKHPTNVASKVRRGTLDNTINFPEDENTSTAITENGQRQLASNFSRTPMYIQPKGQAFHSPTMQQQLNSIQRLKPKFCNRRGRRPRSKQVVVERKLPLLPNNLSGHQIVRMSIISQEPTGVSSDSETVVNVADGMELPKVIADPEEENSIISTVPSSPSRILKEGDSEWISAEVADYSLSSLLGHLESPVKNAVGASASSNMATDLSNDVDVQLHSLLTESSVDFAVNFADLAASVVHDKKF